MTGEERVEWGVWSRGVVDRVDSQASGEQIVANLHRLIPHEDLRVVHRTVRVTPLSKWISA